MAKLAYYKLADFSAVFFHISRWYLSWNKFKSQESIESLTDRKLLSASKVHVRYIGK